MFNNTKEKKNRTRKNQKHLDCGLFHETRLLYIRQINYFNLLMLKFLLINLINRLKNHPNAAGKAFGKN